jgi:uncharacterized protein with von Willebrand factor type A (vWA) domain
MSSTMDEGPAVETALVGFGRALRENGVVVGSGQVVAYCRAVAALNPADPADLYWAGRACLVSRREDLEPYDRIFRQYFLGSTDLRAAGALARDRAETRDPLPIKAAGETVGWVETPGAVASSVEILRRKRFSECTPDELAALRRLIARLRVEVPKRRARRTAPAARGRSPDLRRTLRRSLRTRGELLHRHWRKRRVRPRRLVLILDISGSMAEFSRALLQFAHSAAARTTVEVFCFGTRLTRVTEALRWRDADRALGEAADAVVDWEGGTRIGDSLREFLAGWGRHGLARGAVVVICSDGLERGDPEVLEAQMGRLSRLAHRVVWVNPLKGDPTYEPLARGMAAALPHVDVFVSGHDLASLEALTELIPSLG